MNLQVWKPGRDLSIDEAMIGFEGRASETTTIPNKPTPTGFKTWCITNRGFLLLWIWHIPGDGNGPVGVRTPRELGGSLCKGKGGNKTQAVAYELLRRLPRQGYHVYIDNLFTSMRFLEFLRKHGYGATGTCRTNSGVLQELINIKKSDTNDIIPWGTLEIRYTENVMVSQMAWKDNAVVLLMSM